MVYTQFFLTKQNKTKNIFAKFSIPFFSSHPPPLFEIINGFNLLPHPPKNYQELCPRPRPVLYVVVSIMESVPL